MGKAHTVETKEIQQNSYVIPYFSEIIYFIYAFHWLRAHCLSWSKVHLHT